MHKHELYTIQVLYHNQSKPAMRVTGIGDSRIMIPAQTIIYANMIKEVEVVISSDRPNSKEAYAELRQALNRQGAEYKIETKMDSFYSHYVQFTGYEIPHPLGYQHHFEIKNGGIPAGFLFRYMDTIKSVKVEFEQSSREIRGGSVVFRVYDRVEEIFPLPNRQLFIDKDCQQEIYYYLFTAKTNRDMKSLAHLDKMED